MVTIMDTVPIYQSAVAELNNTRNGNINFVVIGAMDGVRHDALSQSITLHTSWTGLLVEPVREMFEKLCLHYTGRSNLKFENCAIGEYNGKALITRVPLNAIGNEFPDWLDGCSTLVPSKHIISKFQDILIKEEITVTPLSDVFKKHDISNINIFQCDTEGYDKVIFEQLWKTGIRPEIIYIEIVYLNESELAIIQNALEADGYSCTNDKENLIAIK